VENVYLFVLIILGMYGPVAVSIVDTQILKTPWGNVK